MAERLLTTVGVGALVVTLRVTLVLAQEDLGNAVCHDEAHSRHFDVNEYQNELQVFVKDYKAKCGAVCRTNDADDADADDEPELGAFGYKMLRKRVDCRSLFQLSQLMAPEVPPVPLRKIPKFLVDDFTLNGRIKLLDLYMNSKIGTARIDFWSKKLVDERVSAFRGGNGVGSYPPNDVLNIEEYVKAFLDVAGKHILVIGSEARSSSLLIQRPWLEAMLLAHGAAHVTTLEYNGELQTDHPNITLLTPKKMSHLFLVGNLSSFDAMVTFSSLEHSGLGRYGDDLLPYADLVEMARAWCVLKPGAKVLVGVPASRQDKLLFNAARIYGPVQYAQLFANFHQVHTKMDLRLADPSCEYCYQPLHLLQKPE